MTGRIIPNANIIEVRQGDSFSIKINIKKNDEHIDMTGSQIKMQVRGRDDNTLKFTLPATPIDIAKGWFVLLLTPEQTNINVGDYDVDIELTTPDGSINTIFPSDVKKIGIFRITRQVTHD